MTRAILFGLCELPGGAHEEKPVLVDSAGRLLISGISSGGNSSTVTAASIGAVTTSANGTDFTGLAAGACTELVIANTSAVEIEYQRGGAGSTMPIPAGVGVLIEGVSNSSQIGVRRSDQAAGQVTVKFERRTRS